MRTLSENEKKIIQYLVDAKNLRNQTIIELIDRYVNVCVITWDSKYTSIKIYSKEGLDTIEDRYCDLLDLIFLLDYLRSEKYIDIYTIKKEPINAIYDKSKYRFDTSADPITEIIELNPVGGHSIINPDTFLIYTNLGEVIYEYSQSAFHVRESLKELVRNDFKTEEQIKFEKQLDDSQSKHNEAMITAKNTLFWTQFAFVVAFLSTLFAIIIGLVDRCSEKDLTIRELNKTLIENKIPDVISTKLSNDTIKAIIVNQPQKSSNKQIIKQTSKK